MPKHQTPDKIRATVAFQRGRVEHNAYTDKLGWWYAPDGKSGKRASIINAGVIHVGMRVYYVGVCVGRRDFFLGLRGRLWRYPGKKLHKSARSPSDMSEGQRRVWADAIARAVSDRLTPPQEAKVMDQAIVRYRAIVKSLVNKRIVDAAALGVSRTPDDYARAVSECWRAFDMHTPGCPDMTHAVMCSLALALDADDAAQLIELAALLQFRTPIVTRESALTIYQQAVTLLARLVPQWWSNGYTCEWAEVGSIERVFRLQYIRTLNLAWVRDIPVEHVAGVGIRKLALDGETESLSD